MATYYTLLTKIGQARIANAVALNQMVNLTYMAVGDGNGNPTTPNENQTALVREKYRATINQLTVDPENPNYLVAEMIVPTTVGGWSIYEVGVFDDQNQLIAVANFPATYKPELVEGSGRDLIVRIIIQVSNTSVVTLKIDPAITLASQAWVAANFVKKTTVAGGTTGQVLVKKSNANEDFQWVDQTSAVDVNVFSREETQTVATGQTIINLAQLTTDGAAIYIEGIRLRDDQFTVNSPTRLTLATSYPEGTKVTIVQNEETSRNAFTLKANNLSDLTDKAAALVNLGLEDVDSGRLVGPPQIFTSSGTYTPHPKAKRIIVEVQGGGGGGAGTNSPSTMSAASGGGASGAYAKGVFDNPTTQTVTIGSGGTGGVDNPAGNGNAGGQSSFGSLITAVGGNGGQAMTADTGVLSASIAGTVPAIQFTGANIFGRGCGMPGLSVRLSAGVSYSGNGGDSQMGAGGLGSRGQSRGGDGTGPGAGGAGANVNGGAGGSYTGGNGADGIVIVWEYM